MSDQAGLESDRVHASPVGTSGTEPEVDPRRPPDPTVVALRREQNPLRRFVTILGLTKAPQFYPVIVAATLVGMSIDFVGIKTTAVMALAAAALVVVTIAAAAT